LQKGYHIRVNLNQVFEVNQGNYVKSLGSVEKTRYFCSWFALPVAMGPKERAMKEGVIPDKRDLLKD
jgi:hypothetical protein